MFHEGGGSGEFEHNIPHLHLLDPSSLNSPLQPFVMVLVPYNYSLSPKYWGAKEREKLDPGDSAICQGWGICDSYALFTFHLSSVMNFALQHTGYRNFFSPYIYAALAEV